tara:strand:+ start:266 stop:418 length:153 start_codon:yes stop_codon:yes gene_type:complete
MNRNAINTQADQTKQNQTNKAEGPEATYLDENKEKECLADHVRPREPNDP